MFIIDLTYIKPLEEVDKNIQEHALFLDKYYSSGKFLISGRKVPRTGGIIIALFNDEQELKNAISEDPFYNNGIATYKFIQMQPTNCADILKSTLL